MTSSGRSAIWRSPLLARDRANRPRLVPVSGSNRGHFTHTAIVSARAVPKQHAFVPTLRQRDANARLRGG